MALLLPFVLAGKSFPPLVLNPLTRLETMPESKPLPLLLLLLLLLPLPLLLAAPLARAAVLLVALPVPVLGGTAACPHPAASPPCPP